MNTDDLKLSSASELYAQGMELLAADYSLNNVTGLMLLNRSALGGCAAAWRELANFPNFSCAATQNIGVNKRTQFCLSRAYSLGDVESARLLGVHYLMGDAYCPRNVALGMDWLQKAVAGGDVEAWRVLGELYWGDYDEYFDAVDRNKAEEMLIEYYKLGGNDPIMAFCISDYYARCVPPDSQKALFWLERCPATLVLAGRMFEVGEIVPADKVKAWEYYRRWAQSAFQVEKSDDEIAYQLARRFERSFGFVHDLPRAVAYYRQAVKGKVPGAFFDLGRLYLEGEGVEPSYEQAVKFFAGGAELKDLSAMTALGVAKLLGDGTAKDFHGGLELLSAASRAHFPDAFLALAHAYEQGLGVIKDYAQAQRLRAQAIRCAMPIQKITDMFGL